MVPAIGSRADAKIAIRPGNELANARMQRTVGNHSPARSPRPSASQRSQRRRHGAGIPDETGGPAGDQQAQFLTSAAVEIVIGTAACFYGVRG